MTLLSGMDLCSVIYIDAAFTPNACVYRSPAAGLAGMLQLQANAQRRYCPTAARFREAGKRSQLVLSLRSVPRRVGMRVDDTCQAH